MTQSYESYFAPISRFTLQAAKPQEDRSETSRADRSFSGPDQFDEKGRTEPQENRTESENMPTYPAERLSSWINSSAPGREEPGWEATIPWESLLPTDYGSILSRAVDRVDYSSKKELYIRLHHPLLLDQGTMSFVLDMATGKKCYTLSARALLITHGNNDQHWKWVHHPDSRFAEVAELLRVWWLELSGKINSSELSPHTTYAAYLIFKLPETSVGFANQTQKASISIRTTILVSTVRLQPQNGGGQDGEVPAPRKDGWMELCLGKFYNREKMNEEIWFAFREVEIQKEKKGLIVEGIEVRPDKQ